MIQLIFFMPFLMPHSLVNSSSSSCTWQHNRNLLARCPSTTKMPQAPSTAQG